MVFGRNPFIQTSEIPYYNEYKLYQKISSMLKGKQFSYFPPDVKIAETTKDLIKRMLTLEENDRISWDEVFQHKALQKKNQINQYLL